MKNLPKAKEVVASLGAGVTLTKTTKEIKEEIKPKEPEFKRTPTGDLVWSKKPSIKDQLALHPNTTKLSAIRCEVFNLTVEEDLAKYNALLERAHPSTAPEIQLADRVEFDNNGVFKVLCKVRDVRYKQLVPTAQPSKGE